MLIALLAVLGVDLIVFLLAGVLPRRRWLRRQPNSFNGAIRVVEGEVAGLSAVEGGARVETAARAGDRERAHGPFLPPKRTMGAR
ncbi:hypothetical protein [Streptomyces sp. NPDC059761]|uniref:hypothetical protein n=1 Tax=Streptomyces sp. NPDC059761 TaxID=3346937 RepID=UPI003649FD4E